MAANIQKQIAALRQMAVKERRRRHVELFGDREPLGEPWMACAA